MSLIPWLVGGFLLGAFICWQTANLLLSIGVVIAFVVTWSICRLIDDCRTL